MREEQNFCHILSSSVTNSLKDSLTTADAVINEALFALIKSKISGEALDLVVAHNPTTWDACKTLLIHRYSDPS